MEDIASVCFKAKNNKLAQLIKRVYQSSFTSEVSLFQSRLNNIENIYLIRKTIKKRIYFVLSGVNQSSKGTNTKKG